MQVAVLLAAIGVCLYSITFLICITMLLLIVIRVRLLKSNVSILLTCNTYANSLIVSSILLLMYAYNLHGNLDDSASFGGQWCELRSYFAHVSFCALYHSFVLQATFRLFRIVFYRHRFLQSFGVFLIAVGLQWILSFLFILPNHLLHDFQYLPFEYNCWVHFENKRGWIMVVSIIFNNPLSIVMTMYTQIIRYTRRSTQIQQRRQHSTQRDLVILKRIVILVFIIVAIGLPTAVIVLIHMITNYTVPYAYHVQGLTISLGVLVTSVSLIFITPRLHEQLRQNRAKVRPHGGRMTLFTQQSWHTQQ